MTEWDEEAQAEWDREISQVEIEAMLYRARWQGVMLVKTPSPEGPGAPGCWLGGQPTLPPAIDWPWTGRRDDPDNDYRAPMRLMAQIDMAQVPLLLDNPILPRRGTLFFFHDPIFQSLRTTQTGGKVIYVEEDVSGYPPRAMPPLPQNVSEGWRDMTAHWSVHRRWPVSFAVGTMFRTDYCKNRFAWRAASISSDIITRELEKVMDRDNSDFHHFQIHNMLFGRGYWPEPELGIPILYMNSDPSIGFDVAMPIAFWISERDLQALRFDDVWVTYEND